MKHEPPPWIAGIVVVLVFAVCALFFPDHPQQYAGTAGSYYESTNQNSWNWGDTISLAAAIIAGCALVVSVFQLDKTNDTVESYIASERGILFPGNPNCDAIRPHGAHALYPLGPNVPRPRAMIVFGNMGRTPVVIRAFRGEMILGDIIPPQPTFIYSVEMGGEVICRPETQTDGSPIWLGRNLTLDEIDAIGVGTTPIHIFGYVRYFDMFGFQIEKGFCFRVTLGTAQTRFTRTAGGEAYNYRHISRAVDAMI